jgi:hypothetical protein
MTVMMAMKISKTSLMVAAMETRMLLMVSLAIVTVKKITLKASMTTSPMNSRASTPSVQIGPMSLRMLLLRLRTHLELRMTPKTRSKIQLMRVNSKKIAAMLWKSDNTTSRTRQGGMSEAQMGARYSFMIEFMIEVIVGCLWIVDGRIKRDEWVGSCVWREMEAVREAEGVVEVLTVKGVSRWEKRPDNPGTEESSRCVLVNIQAREMRELLYLFLHARSCVNQDVLSMKVLHPTQSQTTQPTRTTRVLLDETSLIELSWSLRLVLALSLTNTFFVVRVESRIRERKKVRETCPLRRSKEVIHKS